MNVGFLSVSASGSNPGIGNFIDDVDVERENCCPPWNSSQLAHHMSHVGSGSIAANYTLNFQTSSTLNNLMQTYVEYLNALNSAITSINIEWMLYDQGTGTLPMGVPSGSSPGNNGTAVSGPFSRTWTANGPSNSNDSPTPPGPPFFPAFPMQLGTWYLIHTGIYPNNGLRFFSDECDNNDIYYRAELLTMAKGGNIVFEIKNRKGQTIGRGEVKNRVEPRRRK